MAASRRPRWDSMTTSRDAAWRPRGRARPKGVCGCALMETSVYTGDTLVPTKRESRGRDTTMTDHARVAILGAGFAGLGTAIRLKQEGIEDFAVLEKGAEVGGTWWWNTYPGCQCDIPSHLYSFSFALNPDWSRTYPKQPELERYLRRVSEDFGVGSKTRFNGEVESAEGEGDAGVWRRDPSRGPTPADLFVAAPGPLSEPSL